MDKPLVNNIRHFKSVLLFNCPVILFQNFMPPPSSIKISYSRTMALAPIKKPRRPLKPTRQEGRDIDNSKTLKKK
jgi:hypothetical protein